eukprot:scaffold25_cov342-Pavlova_lutheri.AAC.2
MGRAGTASPGWMDGWAPMEGHQGVGETSVDACCCVGPVTLRRIGRTRRMEMPSRPMHGPWEPGAVIRPLVRWEGSHVVANEGCSCTISLAKNKKPPRRKECRSTPLPFLFVFPFRPEGEPSTPSFRGPSSPGFHPNERRDGFDPIGFPFRTRTESPFERETREGSIEKGTHEEGSHRRAPSRVARAFARGIRDMEGTSGVDRWWTGAFKASGGTGTTKRAPRTMRKGDVLTDVPGSKG